MRKILVIIVTLVLISTGLLTLSSCNIDKDRSFVELDTVFFFDLTKSTIMDLPVQLFLDSNCSITLRKNGTVTINIILKDYVSTFLNMFLSSGTLSDFNIYESSEGLLALELFPGISLSNMSEANEILKNSLGISFVNIDFNDPNVKASFEYLGETGFFPSAINLPKGTGLQYNGPYYIKDVNSEYTGDYKGLFIGKHEPNTEPYTIMTITNDPVTGDRLITFRVEMVKMVLVAREYKG